MSFTIDLYNITQEKNKITKSMPSSAKYTLTGSLKEETDILDPSIIINHSKPIEANYAHISEFNRYYFIKNIKNIQNNIWRIDMHVDVLKSYENGILGNEVVVEKAESSQYSSVLYNDGSFRSLQDAQTITQAFSSGFNSTGQFILITAGDAT